VRADALSEEKQLWKVIVMQFVVWVADLNSLYNEKPNAPVVHDRVGTEVEALSLVSALQDHETAAWYRIEAVG
jgi:hypothetical protein